LPSGCVRLHRQICDLAASPTLARDHSSSPSGQRRPFQTEPNCPWKKPSTALAGECGQRAVHFGQHAKTLRARSWRIATSLRHPQVEAGSATRWAASTKTCRNAALNGQAEAADWAEKGGSGGNCSIPAALSAAWRIVAKQQVGGGEVTVAADQRRRLVSITDFQMSNMVQVVRFAVGLAMVSAGGLLVAPFLAAVVESARLPADPPPANPSPRTGGAALPSAAVFAVPGTGLAGSPVEQPGGFAAVDREQPQRLPADAPPTAESPVRPAELPPVRPAGRPPGLAAAYRSTVEMPPPPLLDVAGPAAARPGRTRGLSSASRGGPSAAVAVAAAASNADRPAGAVPARALPDRYRVRDGDDLTAIATAMYGHPRGAAALWEANADRLESPDLLPIGMPLVVPPAWQVFQRDQAVAGNLRQIEPEPASVGEREGASAGVVPAAWQESVGAVTAGAAGAAGVAPWLGQPAGTAAPRRVPQGRGSLRVAPGETLASIARRVYGDPEMAQAVFDANRDRLRSPDLVEPGMELRLP